jgi:hypothetical protein
MGVGGFVIPKPIHGFDRNSPHGSYNRADPAARFTAQRLAPEDMADSADYGPTLFYSVN